MKALLIAVIVNTVSMVDAKTQKQNAIRNETNEEELMAMESTEYLRKRLEIAETSLIALANVVYEIGGEDHRNKVDALLMMNLKRTEELKAESIGDST